MNEGIYVPESIELSYIHLRRHKSHHVREDLQDVYLHCQNALCLFLADLRRVHLVVITIDWQDATEQRLHEIIEDVVQHVEVY